MAYTGPSIEQKPSWPQESLWDYSLAYYARDSVPQFLLALQDQYDLDVNLILLAIWAGAESGLLLKDEHFSKLDSAVCEWRENVVKPLRAVRRAFKLFKTIEIASAGDIRARIKAAELDAEHVAQIMLMNKISDLTKVATTSKYADAAAANLDSYFKYAAIDINEKIQDARIFLVSRTET